MDLFALQVDEFQKHYKSDIARDRCPAKVILVKPVHYTQVKSIKLVMDYKSIHCIKSMSFKNFSLITSFSYYYARYSFAC